MLVGLLRYSQLVGLVKTTDNTMPVSLLSNYSPERRPGTGRLSFFRGDSHVIDVQVKTRDPDFPEDGTKLIPVDITDMEFHLTVKKTALHVEELISLPFDQILDPTQGKLRFRFAPADTEDLDVGEYAYDIEMRGMGDVFTVVRDVLILQEDVTRPQTLV